ncbi:MAG: DUF3995 domain-containing protein [Streptosporangiales bacterium]|nr:DUF3995 domain-containing protein [Streptosporangiales bacterium]
MSTSNLAHAGPAQDRRPARAPGRTGRGPTGRTGQARTGPGATGPGATGQGSTGQGSTGQGPTGQGRTGRGRPWAGYVGLAWAISYIPIHVHWALGGVTPSIGIAESTPQLRAANWGACLVIAGAGLVCLALTQGGGGRIAAALPRPLLHGMAWIGGVFGILHGVAFTVASALRLLGVVGYPEAGHITPEMMRGYDWFNVLYAEPWFVVMGVLLIAASRFARHRDRDLPPVRPTPRRRAAVVLTLAGVATVVGGVFLMNPWVFALYGPALTGAGLLALYLSPVKEGSR